MNKQKVSEKVSDIVRFIKSASHHIEVSLDGNVSAIPKDIDFRVMINDHYVYLSDKEFFVKWGKELFGDWFEMPDDDEFDEFGAYDEFKLTQNFTFNIKDGGEVFIDFYDYREDAQGNTDYKQPDTWDSIKMEHIEGLIEPAYDDETLTRRVAIAFETPLEWGIPDVYDINDFLDYIEEKGIEVVDDYKQYRH